MEFDVLLPTVIFFVVTISAFLYRKFENEIEALLEEKKFSKRDAVFMVLIIGIMVIAIGLFPGWAIQILFILSYSIMTATFTYLVLKKWYFAIFPPITFILFYFFYWNLYIFNLFAIIFSIVITVYLGALFSWNTTWIFAILLTIMDVIHVFITGFMGESATKMLELGLPIAVLLPTYPADTSISLGLGDLFLAGILSIQTGLRNGSKTGILTPLLISFAMFIFEVALLNNMFVGFFPATVVVIAGWIASVGITHFFFRRFRDVTK